MFKMYFIHSCDTKLPLSMFCVVVLKKLPPPHEIGSWRSEYVCCAKLLQSCLKTLRSLWDPVDHSPLGSSVHGILQSKIPGWVALPSSREGIFPTQGSNSCLLCLLHWQAGSLPLVPPGKPRSAIANSLPSSFLVVLKNNQWTVTPL